MNERKKIALVAHDNCKKNLLEWVESNWEILIQHKLICTGMCILLMQDHSTG